MQHKQVACLHGIIIQKFVTVFFICDKDMIFVAS